MLTRILRVLFVVPLISITLGTAQEPSNTDYFDHITLFSDVGITAGEIWHYLEKRQITTYFMLNTASTADNGENATE